MSVSVATAIVALIGALTACAAREIEPAIPYAAWPRVAQIKRELDAGRPQWLLECPDNRDNGYVQESDACRNGSKRYKQRRAKLQAEFACWTSLNYVETDNCERLSPNHAEIQIVAEESQRGTQP